MKFYLVYNGPLPSSGNKSKPVDVAKIRERLSPQLKYLWETSHALAVLSEVAWVRNPSGPQIGHIMTPQGEPPPRVKNLMLPGSMIDLTAPIAVGGRSYKPLVRGNLHLNCELDILFLRQEDPGSLISQGGDLDGRIKALLDALRMPSFDEQTQAGSAVTLDETYCLMESDALVAGLDIDTERLLFPQTQFPNEVHLVIGVSLRVLRVLPFNTCLL